MTELNDGVEGKRDSEKSAGLLKANSGELIAESGPDSRKLTVKRC
jgi:hypothetical protein